MNIQVLSPFTNVHTPIKPMAPRPASLEGLRPGIIENSKPNAQLLMETWIEELRDHAALGELSLGHKSVNLPPSKELLEQMKANADFVIIGTGDCGSCLAWTVRTAVMLEELGIPTVCAGSHVFEEQFKLEAAHSGMPNLKFVFVQHPLGGVKPDGVRAKATAAFPTVLAALQTAKAA